MSIAIAYLVSTVSKPTTVNIDTPLPRRRVPGGSLTIAEIDDRIAIIRDNLCELVEQAASRSGASNEELVSQRIAEQEAKLELLKKQCEELSQTIATWRPAFIAVGFISDL